MSYNPTNGAPGSSLNFGRALAVLDTVAGELKKNVSPPVIIFLILMPASLPAHAFEAYHCRRDSDVASIEILRERDGEELPCSVVFARANGEENTLWQAQFESGFCARKAARKKDLLQANGWRCETNSRDRKAGSNAGLVPHTDWTKPAKERSVTDRCRLDNDAESDFCASMDITTVDQAVSRSLEEALVAAGPDQVITLGLVDSVSLALRNSREVESGYLVRTRDRMALELAEDEFRPDLTIEGGPGWSRSYGEWSSLGRISSRLGLRLPTGGKVSVGWDNLFDKRSGTTSIAGEITQPLWGGAGIDANLAGLRSAKLDYLMGDLVFHQRIIDLVTGVVINHRDLALTKASYDITSRSLQRASEQKRINEKLLKVGRIARVDAIQSDANIARREVDLITAKLEMENSRQRLLDLLDVETSAQLFAKDMAKPEKVSIDVADALDIAFRHRPDFLNAKLTLQSTKLNLENARSRERWGLDAVATVADIGKRLYANDTIDSTPEPTYSAGLRLNIPLGDVARNQATRIARLGIKESQISLKETVNSIKTEIVNLVANVDTTWRRVALAERAEILAEQQLAAEQKKFARGLSSTRDVIILEDAMVDSELGTLQAMIAYNNTITNLDLAMGATLSTWRIELER